MHGNRARYRYQGAWRMPRRGQGLRLLRSMGGKGATQPRSAARAPTLRTAGARVAAARPRGRVLRRHPRPAPQGSDAGADPTSARVPARGPADRGGVAAAAIEFLTAVGHITDDRRQEFILLSDVLGTSMQTVTMNNEAYANATEATILGPFFVEDSPEVELGGDIAAGAPGQPCWVEGIVTDTRGNRVPHALIEVWEADEDGFYDVQYGGDRVAARGHLNSDSDGRYCFWAVLPTPYPIPHDGPVGELLAAVGRSPMRASHLHFMVRLDGFRTSVTHIFVRGDALLDRDSVFGVRDSLVMTFDPQPAGTPTPDGRDLENDPLDPRALRHRARSRQRVVSVQTRQWLAMRKGVPAMPTKVYLYDAVRTWFGTHGGGLPVCAERPGSTRAVGTDPARRRPSTRRPGWSSRRRCLARDRVLNGRDLGAGPFRRRGLRRARPVPRASQGPRVREVRGVVIDRLRDGATAGGPETVNPGHRERRHGRAVGLQRVQPASRDPSGVGGRGAKEASRASDMRDPGRWNVSGGGLGHRGVGISSQDGSGDGPTRCAVPVSRARFLSHGDSTSSIWVFARRFGHRFSGPNACWRSASGVTTDR